MSMFLYSLGLGSAGYVLLTDVHVECFVVTGVEHGRGRLVQLVPGLEPSSRPRQGV